MNKNLLFEVINKKVESSRQYYLDRIRITEKRGEQLNALIKRLEELEAEPQLSETSISFDLSSHSEASSFVAKLLELLPEVEKFHKVMIRSYSNNPDWTWRVEVGEIMIEVSPTEKPTDCELVQEINVSKSWSCRQRKEVTNDDTKEKGGD